MKVEHRFFKLSNSKQKQFQIKLAISCLMTLVLFALILFFLSAKLMFLLLFVIVLIIQIVAPFFDVPSLVKNGKLKYYSLFLLAEKEEKSVIKIHGGTLFDYYFIFKKEMTANDRIKLVLVESLKGIINLANDANDNVKIEGTSYIINERTANKIGLKKVPNNGIQILILAFNYINLMASFFVLKRKLIFPNLSKIITFQGNVSDIKKRESYINDLILKLESK